MKILSEAKMRSEGWVKEGNIWHSPGRPLPEDLTESAANKRKLESQRPSPELRHQKLVEAFQNTGLSLEAAKIAARL